MLRKDLESLMKQKHADHVVIIINENDEKGVLCYLKGGYLCDCWGKRIDRKANIWGFMKFTNGVMSRHPWPARYEKTVA